ncbi:glyoxalase [Streptomyces solincola]|uniref:Glyoxalase n=1 Tax=Streptomyces solincola TaxID=2100817 RepID=A0A2S9PY03_9ACTN|nr:VOC family protein [Streptomyces solincola]PRH79298.1 glyoxalase [Streptomyces solincola]
MGFATLQLTAFDCPRPLRLAEFYAEVLGGRIDGGEDDDWVELHLDDGQRLAFQRADDLTPPEWPRADRNSQQLHLDLTVQDMDAAHAKVLELGARELDVDDDAHADFRAFADPAGHPFCLCRA